MSLEASKTRAVRDAQFETHYLRGRVIDIGCGPDLVVPHAEPFDLEHGDAGEIAALRPNGAYDTVYSSHCLEHMRDVPKALAQWWALVRDGGHLVIVVPDEDLYEQGGWPSLFNADHKATFRLDKETSWSPVSYDILQLVRSLDRAEIVAYERHDHGYDYTLRKRKIARLHRMLFKLDHLRMAVFRRAHLTGTSIDRMTGRLLVMLGAPVDQTARDALAQIQIIVRKRP